MATRGVLAGPIVILLAFSLAAGCTFWTSDGTPAPTPPPATGTVVPVTAASPAPTFTGAGGAEEAPGPIAPTVIATLASPAVTPQVTETPVATVVTDSGGDATTPEATVAPTPVPTGTATIAELANADPELARFVQALRQGGVYETLNGTGTYTVFAPSNAAFDAVPPGTLTRLLLDRTALDRVANHHVVYGRWFASDLAREPQVTTRSGDPLAVTPLFDGGLQVDGARVVRADLVATNGVVHVIDAVMVPPGAL